MPGTVLDPGSGVIRIQELKNADTWAPSNTRNVIPRREPSILYFFWNLRVSTLIKSKVLPSESSEQGGK